MKVNNLIVGYGYWGKIIEKTLLKFFDATNIQICDIDKDYRNFEAKNIFISTPAGTHFEIASYFLRMGGNVFCEKPPCLSTHELKTLHWLEKSFGGFFFVDWIFTFNPHVKFIKEFISSHGLPKSIFLYKMNNGPVREDVNAKIDLSIHDLSLLYYLTDGIIQPDFCFNYKVDNTSIQSDSFFGKFHIDNCSIILQSSWNFPIKNKLGIFTFDKDIISWDDVKKYTTLNGQECFIPDSRSPLEISINCFLMKQIPYNQKKLSTNVINLLNSI